MEPLLSGQSGTYYCPYLRISTTNNAKYTKVTDLNTSNVHCYCYQLVLNGQKRQWLYRTFMATPLGCKKCIIMYLRSNQVVISGINKPCTYINLWAPSLCFHLTHALNLAALTFLPMERIANCRTYCIHDVVNTHTHTHARTCTHKHIHTNKHTHTQNKAFK